MVAGRGGWVQAIVLEYFVAGFCLTFTALSLLKSHMFALDAAMALLVADRADQIKRR